MTETDLHDHAEDLCEQLPDQADADPDDIHERFETLVSDYKVPVDEARRSILNDSPLHGLEISSDLSHRSH
jgi:replication factor A1